MNFEEFKKSITGIPPEKILFVGLGNRYREEDAAGIIFLHYLQIEPMFQKSFFINAETNPENHLQEIIDLNPALIIFIDTVEQENSSPGIFWVNNTDIDDSGFSTHAYSIKLIEKYILVYINTTVKYLGITVKPRNSGGFTSSGRFQFIADFFKIVRAENA